MSHAFEGRGKIRDPDEFDRSRKSYLPGREPVFEERGILEDQGQVPESHRRRSGRPLVDEIRDEFSGEGLVAIDIRSGDILAVEVDSHALRESLEGLDVDAEHRLVIRCYE